jgi:hypothetical protein
MAEVLYDELMPQFQTAPPVTASAICYSAVIFRLLKWRIWDLDSND